jgi:hypothetical protein
MGVLGDEVQARERTTAKRTTGNKQGSSKEPPFTGATLYARGSTGTVCSYCQQAHPSNSCTVISQPKDRKQALQKAGRCFVCLRRGHISRECRSRAKCLKCGGANDSTTGPSDSATTPSTTTSAPTRQKLHPTLNATAPAFSSQAQRQSTSLWVGSDRAVLLQTARALAFTLMLRDKSE